jgi:hypothetical protein
MTKAESIPELTDKWIQLLQTSGEETALQFYCENIMPLLLPILREKYRKTYGQDALYDGLISLLGFAPDTVILAYQFIRPDSIVVIHTEETKHYLDNVVTYAKIPAASFYHESFTELPATDIYRALEAALKRFPKGSRIAIELTGGKKTMSGALAIAAGVLNIDLIYIDYTKYLPEFRKPRPESTYIHLVGNPLKLPVDLFSEIEINRAVSFFNIGKYDLSRTLFEQAGERMATPRVAEVCANLSQFYLLWNSFSFQDALELASILFDKILHFYGQISSIFQFDIDRLKKQIDTIRNLAEGNRVYLLWNFYFSAERYERNNQKDIAALLYYRTIESTFENALKDISNEFNGDKPDYSLFQIEIEHLTTRFQDFRRRIFKKNESISESLPIQVAMFDSLCLLGALNHPITQGINPSRVANVAKIRNRSIYAHGATPIDTQSVKEIRQLAKDAICAFFCMQGEELIDNHRTSFEFIELVIRKKD